MMSANRLMFADHPDGLYPTLAQVGDQFSFAIVADPQLTGDRDAFDDWDEHPQLEYRNYYKAIATDQGMLANFQNNAQLTDWVNEQRRADVVVCLGDGHDGIWNIITQIGSSEQRLEILDGYHLVENLHKVFLPQNEMLNYR